MNRKILIGLVLAIFLVTGIPLQAKEAPKTPTFVIGVPGRSGCLVCHGDPKLKAVKEKRTLYVNEEVIAKSAHKDVACTKCHTDFTTKSHQAGTGDFRKVAGLSCKNCHQHASQLKVYGKSIHGRLSLTGGKKRGATCGDCHGSHDIGSLKKSKEYRQKYHAAGEKVCGKCHREYYRSYDDYYHGRAYKMKAMDAPACWDCHGTHDVAKKEDPNSRVSSARLAQTCGKCHKDSTKSFTQFAQLIHGRRQAMDENLLIKYKNKLSKWFNRKVVKNISQYYRSLTTSLFQ